MKRILLTTGDVDGIGLEVSAKALSKIKIPSKTQIIVYRSQVPIGNNFSRWLKLLSKNYNTAVVSCLADALSEDLKRYKVIEIASPESPGNWVIEAAWACKNGFANGLVTGPLSKVGLKKSGINAVGHTDLFKKLFNIKDLFMFFSGKHFNVALVTDHIALEQVSRSISLKKIDSLLKNLRSIGLSSKPIAMLGLNPHAGENGLLGGFEAKNRASLKRLIKKNRLTASSFLTPDAAFLKSNWHKYSCFIALYHDQGLIPFKMVHGYKSGVHITLGLPFFRSSVDHGTASDIFDKNIADPGSMKDALLTAFKFTRQ